jgi:hypothetical protein
MLNAASNRFIPVATSNAQSTKYLKPKLKLARWKLLKSEIKLLIAIGRDKNGNVIEELEKLKSRTQAYLYNSVDRLFDLLNTIEAESAWDSTMFHSAEQCKENTFYFDADQVQQMKEDEVFIRELKVFILKDSLPMAREIMAEKAQYDLVVKDENLESKLVECTFVVSGL